MTTLEELGLLKFDFLGLRNLTVIRGTENMLNADKQKSECFHIAGVTLDDKAVYDMLSKGHTNGVFQFESGGVRNVLMQMRPERMEDLMAITSFYRPGPMDSIPRAIQGRHNPETIKYKHPLLKNALEDTYGCMVYQEQVMQICREMAGYSYGRADIVRRAMSKKKHDVMIKEREGFVDGCVANGIDAGIANELFNEMVTFASYAFPKAHAAAYAHIAYYTTYLKFYHTKEYMAALLTSVLGWGDKVAEYIAECKRLGITVLPPDINESGLGFTVVGNKILFGLLAIKNLGRGLIVNLLDQRKEKPFNGLYDFLDRMHGKDLNRRAVECLIKCGAFDSFGHNRKQMSECYERLFESIESSHRNNLAGQVSLFSSKGSIGEDYALPDMDEYPLLTRLAWEKETIGIYLSGHPLTQYEDLQNAVKTIPLGTLCDEDNVDGRVVHVIGIVIGIKTKTTRSGDMMAFVTIEDKTASIEIIVFPKSYVQFSSLLTIGNILVIKGRAKGDKEEGIQITCDSILTPEQAYESLHDGLFSQKTDCEIQNKNCALPTVKKKEKRVGLYLKFFQQQSMLVERVSNVLFVFEGDLPVYFFYVDKNNIHI